MNNDLLNLSHKTYSCIYYKGFAADKAPSGITRWGYFYI